MDILERFAESLSAEETDRLHHVRDYIASQPGRADDFRPTDFDDVTLRTYLLGLRASGASFLDQRRQMASLRRFYDWAVAEGLLEESPFSAFSVERPRLSRAEIRRRQEIFTGTPEEREIARLRALNQLSEQLNRTSDVKRTLSAALETMISLMNLRTGWAFLLPPPADEGDERPEISVSDFRLSATFDLPPGLQSGNCRHLTNPNGCHCTGMVRSGLMTRAVNIVECTRLQDSADADGDNQGLLFHASVPIIASGRPLGIINVATQEWQFLTGADLQLLSAIGAQVAIALERARLYDLTHAQRLRLERELKMAREVQESLLPERLPVLPGFSLAADWRSALEMAGDFYDIFALPDGRWGIVVADVSDKGAAAAMYMAMTRSLVRAGAGSHASPAAALKEVNQRLLAHSSSDMFVTLFYGILDAGGRTLTYANAGQNPPLLRRASGELEKLMPTGPALNIFKQPAISDNLLTLAPGDTLVIYTDGVTDALNEQGEDYGMPRLTGAVSGSPRSNAGDILAHLSNDLSGFTLAAPLFDDITFFIIVSQA
jgi:serine phosphatase RsbU (regulator of sigma subunit)